MGKGERIAVWINISPLGAWLLILTVTTVGDLRALDATLAKRTRD